MSHNYPSSPGLSQAEAGLINYDTAPSGLSIIIPAYNEERGIGPVLVQLHDMLAQTGMPYEIIVVDDGSQDGTRDVIRQHNGIKLLAHPVNKGYGAALKTGILHAQYDLICITDADGTYPHERIFDLFEQYQQQQSDMVVGARIGSKVAIPRVRRPAKWVIGRLASFVCGQPIPDLNSGFRMMKRDAVLPFWHILPDGFSFTTTITLCMLTSNYLVEYVPVDYHIRIGRSKIKPVRDTLNFVQLILRIALYFAPLKVFLPLSLLLLLLATGWGLFTHFVLGQLADVTTIVIVMTAIQVAMLGLLAELINHRVPNIYRKGD